MTRYVKIYCAAQARKDAPASTKAGHAAALGVCYAEKVKGRWRCCCCGKPVCVVER